MEKNEFIPLYKAWVTIIDVDRAPLTAGECGTLYLLDQLLQSAMKQNRPIEVAEAARELGIKFPELLKAAADVRNERRSLPNFHFAWGRAVSALNSLIP